MGVAKKETTWGSGRVTAADVAREAGTSVAVVSYVLNDGPRPVSAESRRSVLAAIHKLNYKPDAFARALRKGRSGLLGLVVPDMTLPFFGSLARALEQQVVSQKQLLITGNTNFDAEEEHRVTEGMLNAGVDGVFIVSEADGSASMRAAEGARRRAIWLHQGPGVDSQPVIRSDHYQAGVIAARHLIRDHGCRRLLFVGSPADRGTVRERQSGFRAALDPAVSVAEVGTDLTPDGAYREVRDLLGNRPDIDGIVVSTFGQTSAVIRAVFDLGHRIPDNIRLVSFDGDMRAKFGRPTVSTVQQNIEEIARLALVAMADPAVADETVLPVRLDRAESCGCL